MGKLIYIANISLDGYVADRAGNFGFTVPTPEVFSTILELVRGAGTYVYGRKMYEVMAAWETAHLTPDAPSFVPGLGDLERDFANVWRGADKLVISTTLATATTQRTRILPSFDADAIRHLKRDQTLTVGGPHLTAAMLNADLVDELHAFVSPIILGGGNPWLPPDLRRTLTLVGERRIGGVVHLHCAQWRIPDSGSWASAVLATMRIRAGTWRDSGRAGGSTGYLVHAPSGGCACRVFLESGRGFWLTWSGCGRSWPRADR